MSKKHILDKKAKEEEKKAGLMKEIKGKKRKEQKKEKEKETEVEIGFQQHLPKFAEREKKKMEKADIIIPEFSESEIKKLRKAETEEEINKIAKETSSNYPEYTITLFKELKKQMEKGKEIKGIQFPAHRISKEKLEELKKQGRKEEIHDILTLETFDSMKRESKRAEKLKELIKNNPRKKIYISAGAAHTPVYHEVKKELGDKESINIKRKHHTEKDLPGRYKKVYNPRQQLSRKIKFRTKEGEKILELFELRSQKAAEKRGLKEKLTKRYGKEEGEKRFADKIKKDVEKTYKKEYGEERGKERYEEAKKIINSSMEKQEKWDQELYRRVKEKEGSTVEEKIEKAKEEMDKEMTKKGKIHKQEK